MCILLDIGSMPSKVHLVEGNHNGPDWCRSMHPRPHALKNHDILQPDPMTLWVSKAL